MLYLVDGCLVLESGTDFDILGWWRLNCYRSHILSKLARDVLAIRVSTDASESCFSIDGRILDLFRSSLSPQTVEGLTCIQDWLRPSSKPINLRSEMDYVTTMEEHQNDLENKVNLERMSSSATEI